MATRTAAQRERQRDMHRENGRYAKVNPCGLCGKSAGIHYYSWQYCNEHGYGVTMCQKCAIRLEALTEADALTLLKTAYHD